MSLLDLVGSNSPPPLLGNNIAAPGNIPDRYKEGFVDFYKQNPDDFMRIGGQAISYVNTPQGERIQFGDTGSASNFRRYLESIGESPIPDQFSAIGLQPAMPNYSSQFENFGKTLGGFGEQLTGFGDQMTGYQDALGSFNEQVGGMGKQFETISNRLDSVDKGLGSLGNQIASLENMQKAQPQEVRPQRPAFNPFNPFGFGGLGSLFGRRY